MDGPSSRAVVLFFPWPSPLGGLVVLLIDNEMSLPRAIVNLLLKNKVNSICFIWIFSLLLKNEMDCEYWGLSSIRFSSPAVPITASGCQLEESLVTQDKKLVREVGKIVS